jgi:hypothetical protein
MGKWSLKNSNHLYHLIIGIYAGLSSTILGAINVASALEGKDLQYNNWNLKSWDWIDWTWTVIGGILGQIIQLIILYKIIY